MGLGKLRLAIGLENGWPSALKWERFWGIKAGGSYSTGALASVTTALCYIVVYIGHVVGMASVRETIRPHSPGSQDGKLLMTFLAASPIYSRLKNRCNIWLFCIACNVELNSVGITLCAGRVD